MASHSSSLTGAESPSQSSDPSEAHSTFLEKTAEVLTETEGLSNRFRQVLLDLDPAIYTRIAHAGGILRRDTWPCGLSRATILQQVEAVWQLLPDCLAGFLDSFQSALPGLSRKEIQEWIDGGWRLQKTHPSQPLLCDAYYRSSPLFFSSRAFGGLDIWVSEALRIAEKSTTSACWYLKEAPGFVSHDSLLHLREWGEKIGSFLVVDADAEEVVEGFIASSIVLLEKISYRIFQNWYAAGFRLMRKSTGMAQAYFSALPENLVGLYQTEMRKVFDLTGRIARELPGIAVAFYQSAPTALLNLNPNVRERVLDIAGKNSTGHPEQVQTLFNTLAKGIETLSYPDQETVINSETRLGGCSAAVSNAYFENAAVLLKSVEGSFFPYWVAQGCLRLEESEQAGIDYFSFQSAESREALAKWKEAVFLETCEKKLSVYARALCGQAIRLKARETEDGEEKPAFQQQPEDGGDRLYLPAFIAEETSAANNFRLYKVAVAHQSAYIEFGTFGPGYDQIAASFSAFHLPELIRDIFFILENGRVDRCLRANYRGLCLDLDAVLQTQMAKRVLPVDVPLHLALEVLLRLVYECLDENALPDWLEPYLTSFNEFLADLYTPRTRLSDLFLRAADIYDLLKDLIPKEPYLPFESLEYLELSDLELVAEGQGDELGENLKSGEESDGYGVELTEEEMEKLIEMLKEISTLEPIEKGEGGKGIVIEGLTAMVTGELEDADDDDPRPEERIVSRAGLPKLTTRKGPFFYDEWDYLQRAYRKKWCCLREVQVQPAATGLYEKIYDEYSDLIRDVKRQFQRIRPEEMEPIRRQEWGSEIDFNAMIQNVVDRKLGDTPSDRIFSRREKKQRRISTFLLIDMSASTDRMAASLLADDTSRASDVIDDGKRIIDIEIESLVVMAEALEALDDSYAIFGFSGYGREQVELFSIKDFSDTYSQETKNRICGIQPRKSTRMGPAIRHASNRLKETESDHQLLIMLSDGYPQDMNYGEDRSSQTYALHDTMMALVESKRAGIRPFCITIDRCGDDYLRQMIDPGSYLVINDIYSLPAVLPRVVEKLMG